MDGRTYGRMEVWKFTPVSYRTSALWGGKKKMKKNMVEGRRRRSRRRRCRRRRGIKFQKI